MERSMIYTALTRSKKLTIFVGDIDTLNMAIQNPPRADMLNHGFRPFFDT
jgi:exodeoxyribonuclease V alpha subunit